MNTKKNETVPSKPRRDTSGISFYLRTGRLNPSVRGRRRLQQYLRDLERDLIAMQGGDEHVTTAREILIKGTIEAFGVVLLAAMHCRRKGVLRPDRLKEGVVELQPVLGHQFLAFLNTIRQNLIALGLDKRKAEGILDLGRYLAEKKTTAGKLAEPLLVKGVGRSPASGDPAAEAGKGGARASQGDGDLGPIPDSGDLAPGDGAGVERVEARAEDTGDGEIACPGASLREIFGPELADPEPHPFSQGGNHD